MKQFKLIILFFAVALSFLGAGAQDISLNVQTAGFGTVPIGGSVLIEMQINNLDPTVNLQTYKIRPRLTVPASVTIAASGHILPPGFTIVSQTSQIITLSNATNALAAGSSVSAFINVTGGPAIAAALTVQGNLLFSTGVAPGTANGPATAGDIGANNSSTTTVEVVAASACTLTAASAAAPAVACNGGTTTLTVTATGGVAPLEYSINGGTYQSANTFTVPAGTYTATAREAANTSCNAVATAVVIAQPAAITASAAAPAALCNGGTTTLTATATGGTGALQYSLNAGAYQSANTFTVNAAGSPYTVTVRDANLCTTTASAVTVTQPATAVTASAAVTTAIAVFGGTGSITVTATGGTGTKTYVVTTGTTINTTGASSGVFTGLLAGTYTFTATDANGCSASSAAVILSQPGAVCNLAVSASATAILCNGGTATLTATATGANGAVQYSLNGGAYQSANTFTVNAAGSPYTVTAREVAATTCTATATAVTVAQPAAVAATAAVTTPIAVFGGTGSITVTATGGTGAKTYVVTTGTTVNTTGATSGVFTGLSSGTYTFTVSDANSCSVVTAPVSLVQPGLLIADPAVGQMNFTTTANAPQNANALSFAPAYKLNIPFFNLNQLNEVPNGTIEVIVSLGSKLNIDPAFTLATAPLSNYFTWTSAIVADSVVITGTQTAAIPADFASTLVFNVKGKLSCTSTISSRIKIVNTLATLNDEDLRNNASTLRYTLPVTIATTQVNVTCNGAGNGIINAVASPGAIIVIRNAANAIVSSTGLVPGVYSVTATATADAGTSGDCSNVVNVTIVEPTVVSASLLAGSVVNNICNGGSNGSLTVVGAGGTAPYTYTITGPTVNTTGAATGTFTGLSAGTYTVTATDANGCTTAGATVTVVIGQPTTTAPDITIGSDITGSLFTVPGTSQTIVYNIAEINGNAAVGDTLRITKIAGFTISFNPAAASTVVTGTTYVLDNSRWKIDNSNPAFVSIILKDATSNPAIPGTLYCNERVNISVTLTRNTTDISTFPLSARFRKANGEVNLANNFNAIIFAAD